MMILALEHGAHVPEMRSNSVPMCWLRGHQRRLHEFGLLPNPSAQRMERERRFGRTSAQLASQAMSDAV